jgi:hypothetical protein
MPKAPKAPEWLNAEIQELYQSGHRGIRAIQRAVQKKRGVKIPDMTISNRMDDLGLARPRDNSKKAKAEASPTPEGAMPEEAAEVLPAPMNIDETDTDPIVPEVSAVADLVPIHEITEPLSPDEVQTLEHYEQIIAQGLQTFVEVGHALLTIRDLKLYRKTYPTFEAYCRERWNLSRPRAYQLIDAAQVVDTVSTIVDSVPVNEAQARPLATLPAEQQREVWREAVETAPPSGMTARHVQQTVKRAQSKPTGIKITPKSQAEETRERMDERGWPNHTWIYVLSQAHRLSSGLTRLPDFQAVIESWGPAGRQKAIESLKPLAKDIQAILSALSSDLSHSTVDP